MAKLSINPGSTSQPVYVKIFDSTLNSGAGLTGLTFNTSGLSAYYVRVGGSATAITLVTQTVTGAYSSGGFVEVSSTNMPGLYRLDIPDAALATGARSVVVQLKGAANMVPCELEIDLDTQADVTRVNGQPAQSDVDPEILVATTIATLTSQTVFTLTAGSADDTAYKDALVVVVDASTPTQKCFQWVSAYAGSTKQVTLQADPAVFTMAAGDNVYVLAPTALSKRAIAEAVWNAVRSSYNTSGTFGEGAASVRGLVTGPVQSIGNDAISSGSFLPAAITSTALATSFLDAVADALLKRNVSNTEGSATEHTLTTVILAMLEHVISGTTLTIKKTDGTTTYLTKTLTTTPVSGADLIQGIN